MPLKRHRKFPVPGSGVRQFGVCRDSWTNCAGTISCAGPLHGLKAAHAQSMSKTDPQETQMAAGTPVLDLDVIRNAPLAREPYSFFMGDGFLKSDAVEQLRAEFPDITKPGF